MSALSAAEPPGKAAAAVEATRPVDRTAIEKARKRAARILITSKPTIGVGACCARAASGHAAAASPMGLMKSRRLMPRYQARKVRLYHSTDAKGAVLCATANDPLETS